MPVTLSTKTLRPSPVCIKFLKKRERLTNGKRKRCSKVPCLPDAPQCPDACVTALLVQMPNLLWLLGIACARANGLL